MKYRSRCVKCGAYKPEFTIASKHIRSYLPDRFTLRIVQTSHVTCHLCMACFEKLFPGVV